MMLPRACVTLGSHSTDWGCSGAPTPLPALPPDLASSSSQNNIRDITDSLIEQCLDKKLGTNTAMQIPKEKIVNLVNDLFGAGIPSHFSSAVADALRFSSAPPI